MIVLPNVTTQTEFFAFEGGLDTESPALRIPSGMVFASQNYEPVSNGGYRRIKGYELFDGRPSPSAATVVAGSATTAFQEATALVAAAAVRRAAIGIPAGSGEIRGLCYYSGALWCFRDNVGGTAGQMFKSSATGWQLQTLGEEVAFSNANASVGAGDTLTQGSVTATIMRVVVQTGTLASGTNTGYLIISGRAGGNYTNAAATSTGGGTLSLGGQQAALTLPPGGKYNFSVYNFYGQAITSRMYGCNGVGKAFEWDGTTFVYLRTGATTDAPTFIKPNRKYMFLAQGSSIMYSSVGDPYRWSGVDLAGEIAVGDTITGLAPLPGEALAITCRNSSFALTGSSSSTFVLTTIRDDVGAVPFTLQTMSDTYLLDDRGFTSFKAVQDYGNFADSALSKSIQKNINSIRTKVVCSYVSRQKSLYVLLMNDGSTLMMGTKEGRVIGFMEGLYNFIPSCVFSGEDETGVERFFVGTTTGSVYELDKGSTFDGEPIEALIKISYNNSNSPRIRKRYRKLILEMSSELYSDISVRGEFSYGTPDIEQTNLDSFTLSGAGGSWNTSNWEEIIWDSQDIIQPEISLSGTGTNISLLFYSSTTLDFGHTLQGAIMHYTARRQQR